MSDFDSAKIARATIPWLIPLLIAFAALCVASYWNGYLQGFAAGAKEVNAEWKKMEDSIRH